MALIYADRVKETTATTGTGTVTLAGAVSQFQSFAVVGNTNTCDYCILGGNGTDWETGNGTYTSAGTTLSRDTVFASSNSGSKISLTGTSTVFLTVPAKRVSPPTSANTGLTTWANQGVSTTVTDSTAGITLFDVSNGAAYGWKLRYKAVPSTPYTIKAQIAVTGDGIVTHFPFGAVGWFDGTKLDLYSLFAQQNASPGFNVIEQDHFSDYTTSVARSGLTSAYVANPTWIALNDDGTAIHVGISFDGVNFVRIVDTNKTSGYLGSGGYTNVAFGIMPYSSQTYVTLMSWNVSAGNLP